MFPVVASYCERSEAIYTNSDCFDSLSAGLAMTFGVTKGGVMTKHPFKANPIYIVLFAAAVIFYVAGVCAIHSDLYKKVCTLEHKLVHMEDGRAIDCLKGR